MMIVFLFEKFIQAREIECAVLGNNPPEASLPGEIIISDKYEFYTFDAKYVDDKAVSIVVPAKIEETISQKIRAPIYSGLPDFILPGLCTGRSFPDAGRRRVHQ